VGDGGRRGAANQVFLAAAEAGEYWNWNHNWNWNWNRNWNRNWNHNWNQRNPPYWNQDSFTTRLQSNHHRLGMYLQSTDHYPIQIRAYNLLSEIKSTAERNV
jgi:hypothetical protein